MDRLADCPIKLGNRLGQPIRRIEATRRVLGLSVVLSCDVGTATPDISGSR